MVNHSKSYSDAALAALGLQVRREASDYILPALGILSVGLLAGAGLGLLFAPRRGSELREELGHGVNRTLHGVTNGLRKVSKGKLFAHAGSQDEQDEHDGSRGSYASDFENGRERLSSGYESQQRPASVFPTSRTSESHSSSGSGVTR